MKMQKYQNEYNETEYICLEHEDSEMQDYEFVCIEEVSDTTPCYLCEQRD